MTTKTLTEMQADLKAADAAWMLLAARTDREDRDDAYRAEFARLRQIAVSIQSEINNHPDREAQRAAINAAYRALPETAPVHLAPAHPLPAFMSIPLPSDRE